MSRFIKLCVVCLFFSLLTVFGFSQESDDVELALDLLSPTIPTPKIFKPNLDLSGRGFHHENTWPQQMAAQEALAAWQKDIGFPGLYRLQCNLWDISQLSQNKDGLAKLLSNYENIIKSISESGGVVIVDIFGTPAGMGKVLDNKSAPINTAAFKEFVKRIIQDWSCEKKYNIWYEVWNAPDLEDFFLGRQQEYLNLYRIIGESIKELEGQYKINIPLGGPSVSGWFHNLGGNTIFTPEKSLIYELIKFCSHNHLPLDFISWHGFSSDPKSEKEKTIYKKNPANLIRDWLSYFSFDKNTPLIIDEWNYDHESNVLPERQEKSYITASFIPSRIKNMFEAGVDNQVYFALEDFQGNKEEVNRNVGVFYFNNKRAQYKGGAKVIFNVFKILKNLGPQMYSLKLNDDFIGALATKSQEDIAVLIYNYIDPEAVKGYLAANIADLNPAETKFLLNIIRSEQLVKILSEHEDVGLLNTSSRVKSLLKSAQLLNDKAKKFESKKRNLKISIKNLKSDYRYIRFSVDASCALNCEFNPVLEKEILATDLYREDLELAPYSVNLILLKKKTITAEGKDAVAR